MKIVDYFTASSEDLWVTKRICYFPLFENVCGENHSQKFTMKFHINFGIKCSQGKLRRILFTLGYYCRPCGQTHLQLQMLELCWHFALDFSIFIWGFEVCMCASKSITFTVRVSASKLCSMAWRGVTALYFDTHTYTPKWNIYKMRTKIAMDVIKCRFFLLFSALLFCFRSLSAPLYTRLSARL